MLLGLSMLLSVLKLLRVHSLVIVTRLLRLLDRLSEFRLMSNLDVMVPSLPRVLML